MTADPERVERMKALAREVDAIADTYDDVCRRAWVELHEYPSLEGRPLPGYDELTAALGRIDELHDVAVLGHEDLPGRWFDDADVVEAAFSWEARKRAILARRAQDGESTPLERWKGRHPLEAAKDVDPRGGGLCSQTFVWRGYEPLCGYCHDEGLPSSRAG